ncbi:NAD-dependent epimerase/dehydratase family protein, partial [Salmonella enterica]|nr:NAD-dependent epimerase/dehydratase family protein [Salmonella enterica]
MSKKILIIGANGMLGSSLLRFYSKLSEYDVLGTVRNDEAKLKISKQGFTNTISNVEFYNLDVINKIIAEFHPDYVFNCVGIIKQLNAAKDYLVSISVNSLLPHQLAQICSRHNAKLIHFSTDCVFSGRQG